MAVFNKFNAFVADVGNKVHNLGADTLKVMLSASPPAATNAVKADIAEIAAGNGYSAGGTTVGSTAYSQTGGVAKLTGANVVFTASGGSIASFRYAVLYNATPAPDPLIGWFDYGSPVVITVGNQFTVAWDASNGILTLT